MIERLHEQGIRADKKGRHRSLMDIHVRVTEGAKTGEYVIEVQTGRDGEVFVRISRYILGAAASRTYSEKIDGKDRVCVDLPDMALVYLRPPKNMAAEAELCIRGSGQELIHPIQVLRMDHMTLETMLDRNLLFLVPFYLFRYADKLSEIQDDP